jgi:hypothetical protein
MLLKLKSVNLMPDTYSFTGDAVTFLGLVGVVSAFIIVVTAFRRFFNSPYNVRYVKPNVDTIQDNQD